MNLGVAEGFRRGIITSASLVATGSAFESAVSLASELAGLGIGVHLAADEYSPVLPPAEIPRMVDSGGRFYSRGRQFERMFVDRRIRRELVREWDAQILKILRAGINLTHIDGHGHCHAHPVAADTVLELARRYGISRVRVPAEPLLWRSGPFRPARFAGKSALWCAARVCANRWRDHLQSPRAFFGFSHGGRMTAGTVRDIAFALPEGTSELMVHVGVSNKDAWPGYDFVGDLQAVTTHSRQEFERAFDVSLVSHISGGN